MKRINNKSKRGNSRIDFENKLSPIPKSKRSQLKIQEMAFMLVGVVLFFGLVMLFVLTIVYKNMYRQVDIINQEKTLTSLINLADSPEFRCVTTKSNCIDGDKVISLMNKTAYANFWPFSSLKVIRMSGFNKDEGEMTQCNLANYANVYCKGGYVVTDEQPSESIKSCTLKWKYIKTTNSQGGEGFVDHIDQIKRLYLSSGGRKYTLSSSDDLRTSLSKNTVYTTDLRVDLSTSQLGIDLYCQRWIERYSCPGDRDCRIQSPYLVDDPDLGTGSVYEVILNGRDGGDNVMNHYFRYALDCKENLDEIPKESQVNPRTCSPDCDIIDIYDKKVKNERVISSYVALCRKEYEKVDTYTGYTYDKCEIAKLIAGTELKNMPGVASKAG